MQIFHIVCKQSSLFNTYLKGETYAMYSHTKIVTAEIRSLKAEMDSIADQAVSQNGIEGVSTFIEKRKPIFK